MGAQPWGSGVRDTRVRVCAVHAAVGHRAMHVHRVESCRPEFMATWVLGMEAYLEGVVAGVTGLGGTPNPGSGVCMRRGEGIQ